MKCTPVISITCGFLLLATFNSHAALVSADWKAAGDNLITEDTVSGMRWLDVSESYNLNYNTVSGEFGPGGQFEGFRYATDAEVLGLWSNFGIDLSAGATTTEPGWNPAVQTAAELLGNTWNTYAWWDYPYGVSGITGTPGGAGHNALGAYQTDWGTTQYETVGTITLGDALPGTQPYGSYLVEASVVPVPAAAWLFGSALLVLLGAARRKAR